MLQKDAHWVLHDAPITKLMQWLWHTVYIAMLLSLEICEDNLLTCSEIPAASS